MIYSTPTVGDEEQAAIGRIEDLRSQLKPYVAEGRHRWVGVLGRMLAARAIQGSNSIEGYVVSDEDALAAVEGEAPVSAEDESWQAVSGYRRAMTFVIQQAKNPEFAYSVQLLQNLHYMMTEHDLMNTSAGLWRLGPIWVKRAESGETVYDAPDPELVSALMRELVAHLQFDTGTPPLIAAAMAHLNLVMIHPFRDGNGRMARGLQTLVLAREGVVAQEYSSIEEYLGRERPSYYQILADVGRGRWNPDGDARPWVRYCLEAHFIQMTKVLRQVRETEEMWRLLGEVARTHRLPERTLVVLLLATRGLRIRNAAYRAALRSAHEEVSIQVATSDLAAIVRAGLLVQHGVKRGTYYVAGQALKEISQLFRDRRTPIDASHLFTPSPDLFATIGDLFTTSGASFPQSTASATTLSPQLSWQSGTAGRR